MIRPPWRRRPPHQPGLTAHDGRAGPPASATHYATLGLTRDARAKDIVRAYRRLAKHHHPDVSADTTGADAFKRASAAYDVLSDPARRRAYDASLDAAAAAASPARRPVLGATRGETAMLIALAVLACVGLLYILVFALGYREDARTDTSPTDTPAAVTASPSRSVPPAAGGVPSAAASTSPTQAPAPITSAPALSTAVPATTSPQPSTPSPTAPPTASPTATPTSQPSPTAPPVTQPPATQPPVTQPPATPPPATATPTRCVVPNVIGLRRNAVQPAWLSAGFTTLVTFLGPAGNYVVGMQTPAAVTTGPCATTNLTVSP